MLWTAVECFFMYCGWLIGSWFDQGFKGAFAASTATDGVTAKSCGYGNDAPKGSWSCRHQQLEPRTYYQTRVYTLGDWIFAKVLTDCCSSLQGQLRSPWPIPDCRRGVFALVTQGHVWMDKTLSENWGAYFLMPAGRITFWMAILVYGLEARAKEF